MHRLSWVVPSRQEVCYGYLLSCPDVAPHARFCPLLHGPQLCLLPKLSRGPDGGGGPQMSDASRPLRLLPPARPQQLGTVSGGIPMERDRRHGALSGSQASAASTPCSCAMTDRS